MRDGDNFPRYERKNKNFGQKPFDKRERKGDDRGERPRKERSERDGSPRGGFGGRERSERSGRFERGERSEREGFGGRERSERSGRFERKEGSGFSKSPSFKKDFSEKKERRRPAASFAPKFFYKDEFPEKIFVVCLPGLEALLEKELCEMGLKAAEAFCGADVFNARPEDIYRINYGSRLAMRVLMPLVEFPCHSAEDLYEFALKIDWTELLPEKKSFAIQSSVFHSEIRNSLYATQKLKDAICDSYREKTGERPDVDRDDPQVSFHLFISEEKTIISYDTSGDPLFMRGWRKASGEAPLQETLAAGMLKMVGYNGGSLVDPCTGSGTLLVEAAMMATNTPPGYFRQGFAFERLSFFKQEAWDKVKADLDSKIVAKDLCLAGVDILPARIKEVEEVVSRLKIRRVDLHTGDFMDETFGHMFDFMVVNPPFGHRMERTEDAREIFQNLSEFAVHHVKESGKVVFIAPKELAPAMHLRSLSKISLKHGGLSCYVVVARPILEIQESAPQSSRPPRKEGPSWKKEGGSRSAPRGKSFAPREGGFREEGERKRGFGNREGSFSGNKRSGSGSFRKEGSRFGDSKEGSRWGGDSKPSGFKREGREGKPSFGRGSAPKRGDKPSGFKREGKPSFGRGSGFKKPGYREN